MRWSYLVLPATVALSLGVACQASSAEENAEDFMGIHKIEIIFHEAGTTKNLDQMLSLFADDATFTSGGKTYQGKEQIKKYWQVPELPAPECDWVAYTTAFASSTKWKAIGRIYISSVSMLTRQLNKSPPTPIQTLSTEAQSQLFWCHPTAP